MFGGSQLARSRFYDDLGTTLEGGLPVREALSLLGDRGGGLGAASLRIERRVREGVGLADAMAEDGGAWSSFERRVVEAGERGGRLPMVLRRLSRHFEQRGAARDRIGMGLIYPVGLVHAAFLIGPLYLLFTPDGGPVAYFARAVLPLLGLYAVAIGVTLVLKTLRASEAGRHRMDALALALPGIGGVVGTVALLEYSSTLGALFASGLPAAESMESAASATRNAVIGDAGRRAAERVRAGERMHEALGAEPAMPRLLVEAVRLGETTGRMDEALDRVERSTREDADRKIKIIATAVPVFAYLCAVLVIGYTVITVYSNAVLGPMREAMGR